MAKPYIMESHDDKEGELAKPYIMESHDDEEDELAIKYRKGWFGG